MKSGDFDWTIGGDELRGFQVVDEALETDVERLQTLHAANPCRQLGSHWPVIALSDATIRPISATETKASKSVKPATPRRALIARAP